MTRILLVHDRFFDLPTAVHGILAAGAVVLVVVAVGRRCGHLPPFRRILIASMCVVVLAIGVYGYYKVFRRVMGVLGRNLPEVTLLTPEAGKRYAGAIPLRAEAFDKPGALGPIAAVRRIEFWLYHPSFVEQHPGNHESKVIIGQVAGPRNDDRYETRWICSNPYTPPRDGDHTSDERRSYRLPRDGRSYEVQAHGIDDEWFAKPGRPGRSQRVAIEFVPCD